MFLSALSSKYLCLLCALEKNLLSLAQPAEASVSSSSGLEGEKEEKGHMVQWQPPKQLPLSPRQWQPPIPASMWQPPIPASIPSPVAATHTCLYVAATHTCSSHLPLSHQHPYLSVLPHHCTSTALESSKSLQVDQLNLTTVG